ncbi:hypothetical protein V8P80_14665 [Acinetobacter baumannii]
MDKCREEFEAIAKELDLDCEWVDFTGTTVLYGANGQKKDGCYNDFTTDTAWNFYRGQQAKVEELEHKIKCEREISLFADKLCCELQKRVDELERKLQIKTRHCEFYEQSRKGHRSLAIHRKKQINSALEQIENLYAKAESDYEKERNPYYDGILSALDLAEQAIRGELEEQAIKGEG